MESAGIFLWRRADGDLVRYADVRLAEHSQQKLDSPDILAIKGLGQFKEFIAVSQLRRLIEDWYVSDFHIEEARGPKDAGYSERISTSGDIWHWLQSIYMITTEIYLIKFSKIWKKECRESQR